MSSRDTAAVDLTSYRSSADHARSTLPAKRAHLAAIRAGGRHASFRRVGGEGHSAAGGRVLPPPQGRSAHPLANRRSLTQMCVACSRLGIMLNAHEHSEISSRSGGESELTRKVGAWQQQA
jgi:hypothetical protein